MDRRSSAKTYVPLAVQTVMLLAAAWGFATAAEHRMTVVEESMKSEQAILQQVARTQQDLAAQLKMLEKIVNAQVVLEDYVHRVRGAQ